MDRKAIIAVVLCAAFILFYRPLLDWLGLGHHLEPPRSTPVSTIDTTRGGAMAPADRLATEPEPGVARPVAPAADSVRLVRPARGAEAPDAALERSIQLETPLYKAVFSNRGARLLSVEVKHYASASSVTSSGEGSRGGRGEEVPPGERVVLGAAPLFGVDLGSGGSLESLESFPFAVAESLDATGRKVAVTFTADTESGLHLRQTYRVRPGSYALDVEVEIRGVPPGMRISDYSLTTRSWPLLTEKDSVADARAVQATSLLGSNLHREHAGGLMKAPKRFDGNAVWTGVRSRYFISAVAATQAPPRGVIASGQRQVTPPPTMTGSPVVREVVSSTLVVGLPAEAAPVHRFLLYNGPCEYFRLKQFDLGLERAVDLGWSWIVPFSRALLQLLNWLYGLLANYGLAILVLATLVRVILHPLNMMSMRSMRAMQKLQPEMERIRAKYKNDPQAMNTAVMALYKENKVNPAGGCLPMLLQMPLFIALYQVLFNAIELRQAPFVAWIDDLSAPDLLFQLGPIPIRLLPILMLASGLLAQRMTPTDPRQMTTMYLMNVVMLVFFYNLPSGLVLYWTIMNVLTAVQQWLVLRADGHAVATVPAPAVATRPPSKRRRTAGS